MEHEQVLLLLGGDRGNVVDTLAQASVLLAARAGHLQASSRDHWTEPWGFEDPSPFLNRAILLRTECTPEELLQVALGIERELGRVRNENGIPAPRTIDIDILLFGDRVINEPSLIVPHPRMPQRAFALAPAADVAPGMCHPLLGRTILDLLGDLRSHERRKKSAP